MMIHRIEAKFPDSYRNGNVLMIHGDCMDVMAEIGEKEIPLAIVDPPYGIGASDVKRGGQQHGNALAPSKQYEKKDWDTMPPPKEYFDELFRVSKNQIIWGGNYYSLPVSSAWVFWDKVTGNNGYADGELAWTSFDSALRMFRFEWHGMLQGNMKNKETRIHPTQKPVALYKWLLSRYAKHGELILDTHGGSGSIVIACHDLGHPIIWVEKDADYYRDAVARYKTHASQAVLFEPVEIMKEQKLFEV
jgi:site-specific DNA-methyltransferase (adenine-specific)